MMRTARWPGCASFAFDAFLAHSLGWKHYMRISGFGLARFDATSRRFIRTGPIGPCSYFTVVWMVRVLFLVVPLAVLSIVGESAWYQQTLSNSDAAPTWWTDRMQLTCNDIHGCLWERLAVYTALLASILGVFSFVARSKETYSVHAPLDRRFRSQLGCALECLFCLKTVKPALPPLAALAYFGSLHAHPVMISYAWGHERKT